MLDRARVRQLFAEASDLPAEKVAAFLARECAGNAALRAEVESLLAAAADRPGFLGAPTASPSTASGAAGEAAGMTIGHYRLVEEIGQGGFGTVYIAEQLEPVRRRVAVKIIKLGMDTRAVIARFEAERQALALMDHANIAKVFDAGATESGRPYFVMELVAGDPITAYCDKHNLSIPERLDVFVQVCRAVQHAHSKGVIHRDIKPGNVLVAAEDGRPHVKVIDFGIAKATQHTLTEKTVFTELRQFIGTPEYMSPEQADGSQSADTRTDVYSLGVLLYELLTGATPFDPKELRSAAYGEIQRIIREVEPEKPSTRVSHSGMLAEIAHQRRSESARLGALIRGDLDWIVMRCLEKDRSRRYDTVEALSADIVRHLAGEPVVAAPPSRAYRVRKFIARHRVATAAGGIILATLLLGVTGTTIGLLQARVARADAEENATRAGKEAARADAQAEEARASERVAVAVNELMNSMIGRADRAKEQGRTDVTVREVMDAAAADLEAGVTTREPRVAAMLAKTIGETYEQLNLLEPAERMLRLYHKLTGEQFGRRSLEHGLSALALGDLLRKRGTTPEARDLFTLARGIAADLGERGVEAGASAVVSEADMDATGGDPAKAEASLRSVLAMLEAKGLGHSHPAVTATHNLAVILWSTGKRAEAQQVYERSLELLRKRGDQPDQVDMLHALAVFQHNLGDFAAAEKSSGEEVALARRLYGDRHMKLAAALDSASFILMACDKPREAIAASRELVAIKRVLFKPGHESLATSLRKLGGFLIELGEYDAAEPLLREACEAAAKTSPAGEPDYVLARYQHAVTLTHRGDLKEAESILRQALTDSEGTLKDGSRLWWMRGITACQLAGVVANRAERETDPAEQARCIEESMTLISAYAERLVGTKEGMGRRIRRAVVGRSLDQVVAACEIAARLAPNADRETVVADWRARRERFLAEMAGKS
jgi:serine/threonine protein kinase/tetratricopeptide (TPR) repeat protein